MNDSTPLVSVVMACYNSTRYLRQAVESVLSQTYRNIELVIVDDCSTDGTVAMIEEYARDDDRVRLIRRTERGGRPAVTKNTGLEHVKGSFVCFLDHDDFYHPEKIETLLGLLQRNPDCFGAFHEVNVIDGEGRFMRRYLDGFVSDAKKYLTEVEPGVHVCNRDFYAFQSIHYLAVSTLSIMIAMDRIRPESLVFDTRFKVCDDAFLWIGLSLDGKMVYADRVMGSYRLHETNITADREKYLVDAIFYIKENAARLKGRMRDDDYAALNGRLVHYLSDLGWLYRMSRRPLAAFKACVEAWKLSGDARHLIHAGKSFLPPRSN